MRFIQSLFAGAALVAAALAVEINDFPSVVQPGKSYRITYSPGNNAPTKFILRKGANADLSTIATLTDNAAGGVFNWNVDPALPNGDDYALEVVQGTENNYIGPIKLTDSSAAPIVSASASDYEPMVSSAASSALTSASATITEAPSSAAASATISSIPISRNTTFSSATISASRTASLTHSASGTAASGAVPTGAASAIGSSPLALIFGAIAAMAYLN